MVRRRLKEPFVAAWGTVSERELVLVRVVDGHGDAGWGEAAPLAGYDGSSLEDVIGGLERCASILASAGNTDRREALAGCFSCAPPPQALSAIDLALWDLEGRRLGVPVWKLLGPEVRSELEVNATVSGPEAGAEASQAGFRCVKVKVGLERDVERVAAVREAVGPEVDLRLDANGAWSVEEAVGALAALEPFGIELCEEPVHGLEEIGRVASASAVPVALDESAALEGALDRRVCDAACLKLTRCGGVSGLLGAAQRARAAGYRVYLASSLDGPLGIAAALHAGVVVGPELPCGLATMPLFDRPSVLVARDGRLSVPPGPGLGDGLVEWYS